MTTGVVLDELPDDRCYLPFVKPEILPSTNLVGRESEIAELDEILDPHITRESCRPGLINIFGLPGIGKASLVKMWQQHLAESRSAVVTNLTQESIEQGYAQGISLCRQLEHCTSDYRADVVFLPIEDNYTEEGSRNPTFQSIETYMSALGANNGRGRNRTVIVLTSTGELRLQKYLLMNLGKSPIRVGALTVEDAIEMAGGDEEKGVLLYQITGGYPPAMQNLSLLQTSVLKDGSGEDRKTFEAQFIALRLQDVLAEQQIWALLNDDPETNPAANKFGNPKLASRQILSLLTNNAEPIHIPEIAKFLGFKDPATALNALDLIAELVEWKNSSDGKHAGYTIKEPLKKILANVYSVFGGLYINSVSLNQPGRRRR